ncbi:hypothetical protein DOT_2868 [Desulfosporosinus sp. OT]|nr:hypothetical protein DOT_2868 [Desulfosporosinus sp. OT]
MGTKGIRTASRDAAQRENIMRGFRPLTSDREPTNNMLTAKAIVVSESDRLATAGEM